MTREGETRELPSWDQLRLATNDWWNSQQKANVNPTRFGHPNEIADHLLITMIPDFIYAHGDRTTLKNFRAALRGLRVESDTIDIGEHVFSAYRNNHPEEEARSLVEYSLASLAPRRSAA